MSYRINLNRRILTYRSFSITYESFFQPVVHVVLCTVKNSNDDDSVDSFLLRRCFGSLPADLRNNGPDDEDTLEVHQEEKMGLLIPMATPS
jgi:hypothetical protein